MDLIEFALARRAGIRRTAYILDAVADAHLPGLFKSGVSSSRKSKVRQRKRLSVLTTRCEHTNDVSASADAPWLALARRTVPRTVNNPG